jgi:hypothetical protein
MYVPLDHAKAIKELQIIMSMWIKNFNLIFYVNEKPLYVKTQDIEEPILQSWATRTAL